MRLLANENVPGEAVRVLREDGHDVVWVRTEAPGSSDRDVLARARSDARIVLTFDKDFGELAFRDPGRSPAGIILLRLRSGSPAGIAGAVAAVLRSRDDWPGHFAVIEPDRVRMRRLRE